MTVYYNPMKCTGCGQKFAFPPLGRSYTDLPQAGGRTGIHFSEMLLLPAWCHDCEGASWVERIPTAREFDTAAALRRRASRRGHLGIEDDLLDIDADDFRWLYQNLSNRKKTPRCLVCASTRFTPIDPMQHRTPVGHDACWDSPIEFRGFSIGSGGLRTERSYYASRMYDVHGDFTWARLRMQEFLKGRLEAVVHARRQDLHYATLDKVIQQILDKDSEPAIALLVPLARAGVPAALGLLGALIYVGEGVQHDGAEAATLLEQAKVLGDACAAHNLASLYATGAPGVFQDIPRARRLFGEARAMGGQYAPDDFYLEDDFAKANTTFWRQS